MYLNKVFLLGNVTNNPQIATLPSGQLVANFGLATNRFYFDKQGNKQRETEFHNIVAFGKIAETIQQFVKQGNLILVEGRLRTRNWEDQQGGKKYKTEIIVEKIQLAPKSLNQTNQPEKNLSKEEIPIIEEKEEIDPKDIPF